MTVVLVTGGAGYIGSHACKALAAAGHLPVAYDNLIYGHSWAVKWGPLERGDILDGTRLSAVIEKYRPSAVLHFAAFAYVGESVTNPAKYYENNVVGTLSLLGAMRAQNIDKIVFSSTCATYGIPNTVPISEDAEQIPINPYGSSKLMIEKILADYSVAYGMKSVALRYFNAAGADPEGEIGESHNPETHLIPLVLDAAAGEREGITVFGDNYPTPDGTCVRDYIHVSDIAEAHVLALEGLSSHSLRSAYNLGTGTGISVFEVIEAARKITNCDIQVVRGTRRAGDPAVLLANPSRAMDELHWHPRVSTLEEMIETAWTWRRREERAIKATCAE